MTIAPAPICPDCRQPAKLIDSLEVYGESFGMLWRCAPCNAHVGVHRNSPEFKPLGTLANPALRRARHTVHELFDPIWKNGNLSRTAAYSMMQEMMALTESQAHIAMFDLAQCTTFVARLTAYLQTSEGARLTQPRMNRQEEVACNFLDSMMSLKIKSVFRKNNS